MKKSFSVRGNIIDIINREIFAGTIYVNNGKIEDIIRENPANVKGTVIPAILPGLIDAHIHIESSMVVPSEFARAAVIHGTVATVSDPHEIANVLGLKGVRYMIENGKKTNFRFYFGAPSCVPATGFETSGGRLGLRETQELLKSNDIKYLSEMMNFPGVINNDKTVMSKLLLAAKYNKPIDGHAPGLRGKDAMKYIASGISTDHECFDIDEAREKINLGMKVLIREGSAAKNFDTLIPLLKEFPDMIMLCSDDTHPDDLITGHINLLVKKALKLGYDKFDVLRTCTYNPVKHYNLEPALLQKGDKADFILIDNLKNFNVMATYINGIKVAENGKSLLKHLKAKTPNNFFCSSLQKKDIEINCYDKYNKNKKISVNVIGAIDGEIFTKHLKEYLSEDKGVVNGNTSKDIIKTVVLNRYKPSKPAIGFINGSGINKGAIASSIAHDSHNIISIGADDENIINAINLIIENKGGIAYSFSHSQKDILKLPVAGIMSNDDIFRFANNYRIFTKKIMKTGTSLSSPFMTLSFMALLVIPSLKLSDRGLFDSLNFKFIKLLSINH